MTLNDATAELGRLRDYIATKPPSPQGRLMFESIQTVLREIVRLQEVEKECDHIKIQNRGNRAAFVAVDEQAAEAGGDDGT